MSEDIKPGYDRVTSCLSFASGMDKIPPEVLQKAADRGTAVHSAIDGIIKGLGDFSEPEHKGYIDSFKLWAADKKNLFKLQPAPPRFYCDELMITGEIDCYYYPNQIMLQDAYIVDFKTSAKESKMWNLQASAYMYLNNKYAFGQSKCIFVKLDKNGLYPEIYEYEYNFPLFKAYLDVYRHSFKNGKEEINIEDL